ncbi:peptidase [Brevibacillus sp. Leaf182]|nr:peptidase [Brevibacillus sp. Leaf182]
MHCITNVNNIKSIQPSAHRECRHRHCQNPVPFIKSNHPSRLERVEDAAAGVGRANLLETPFSMTRAVWNEIIRDSLEKKPNETCGLLSGRNGSAQTVWRMENTLKSPVAFAMDPKQIQHVFHKMALRGEHLVGIYHSHPTAPPIPSPEDIAYCHYPEAAYLIVSLASPQPVLGCFRIEGSFARVYPYTVCN